MHIVNMDNHFHLLGKMVGMGRRRLGGDSEGFEEVYGGVKKIKRES
jgi:hypothetical protein